MSLKRTSICTLRRLLRYTGKMRNNLWLRSLDFFRISEGQIPPKYMRLIRLILYPLNTLYHKLAEEHDVYDMRRNIYTIHGTRYSDTMFRHLGTYGFSVGTIFKVVKREDGTVTVEEYVRS